MSLAAILKILRDVINYLDAHGMILANGTVDFANLQNDLGLATALEQSLKANGVTVPEQVDAVMSMLPMILKLVK